MRFCKKPIVLLIIAAFLLRIFVSFFAFSFRENTDILRYRDWVRIGFINGLSETYKTNNLSFGTLANNQPPGSLYILEGAYLLNLQEVKLILKVFGENKNEILPFINGPFLNLSLRFPSIIADLGIGALIYLIVKSIRKNNRYLPLLSSSLYLFNPLVFYNSAFWGQMDSLNNFFFLLSIFLFLKNKYLLSVVSFFISIYIKFSLIYFLPIIFALVFLKIKWKSLIYFATSIVTLMLLTIPISKNSFSWLFNFYFLNAKGEMQNITSSAFNFWWTIFSPVMKSTGNSNLFEFSNIQLLNSPIDTSTFLNISLSNWGYFLFAIFFVLAFYLYLKNKNRKNEKIFLLLSIVSLVSFLFLPRMHSRYLYSFFPLLAIYIGLTGKNIKIFILFSVLHLINLYVSWHPFEIPFVSFNVLNSYLFQWIVAALTVIAGIYFYFNSLKYLKNE